MVARRAVLALVCLIGAIIPTLLYSQQKPKPVPSGTVTPLCQTGCQGDSAVVYVTPDGQALQAIAGAPTTVAYIVHNIGVVSDTYTLTCSILGGNETCGTVSPNSLTLAPESTATVNVTFTPGAAGTSGTVKLEATGTFCNGGGLQSPQGGPRLSDLLCTVATDSGTYNVTNVSAPEPVVVSPDAATTTNLASTTVSQRFLVQNLGTGTGTYTLTITCTGTLTSCSGPTSISVGAGTIAPVGVSYHTSTTGTTGTVKLKAVELNNTSILDSGWANVTAGGSVQTPVVVVDSVNPGATVERSLCVIAKAGSAGAYECGDLRLVHPLPTTWTLNKARTPTLLYNSQFAHPYPIVAANVTLPTGGATPDSTVAVLKDSSTGTVLGRGTWAGSDWVAGRTARIAVGYDALSKATGEYSYSMEVDNWYGATPRNSVVYGRLAIVNRSSSHFGAGWWLAGLEQINVATMVWVGGDGSVRQYVAVPGQANTWAAAALDRPDTVKWNGTNYVRYLPHGLVVKFDATGKHVATVNRLGNSTLFSYNGDTLKSISLPPSASGLSYQFAYAGVLSSVTPPPIGSVGRTITFTSVGSYVTDIRGPDTTHVGFGLDAGFTNRINARTDRRHITTYYFYDAAQKLKQDSINMGTGQSAIVARFRSLESVGLASATDTAQAYMLIDGPRTDVADTTALWLTRFGAPRRVIDALGYQTILSRTDGRWAALVTRVQAANGQVTAATYDTHGNIISLTDSSTRRSQTYATTSYEWDPKWDFVTNIRHAENDSTVFAYDSLTGNRVWQQDGRGSNARVYYYYYSGGVSYGLLKALRLPSESLTAIDSVSYDSSGNLATVKSPSGYVTKYFRDAVGQDTLVVSPVSTGDLGVGGSDSTRLRQYTTYDLSGRVIQLRTSGPGSVHNAASSSYTRSVYDPDGNVDSLLKWSVPDSNAIGSVLTTWVYDPAGRAVIEQQPGGFVDTTTFDAAGNSVSIRTRRGSPIQVKYDALNRMIQRILPPIIYSDTSGSPGEPVGSFPIYPNCDGTSYCMPGDTESFAYDPGGNLVIANNRDAQVSRTYTLSGLVATDTLRVRTYAELQDGGNFSTHVYGLQLSYDLDGRRTSLTHPGALAPVDSTGILRETVQYLYDSAIGSLSTVTDILGNSYRITYNLDGQVDTIYSPGAVIEKREYDEEGRLSHRFISNGSTVDPRIAFPSPVMQNERVDYDPRGLVTQLTDSVGLRDTMTNSYSGLGALDSTLGVYHSVDANNNPLTETMTATYNWDGLARKHSSTAHNCVGGCEDDSDQLTYAIGTDRVTPEMESQTAPTWTFGPAYARSRYDQSGNAYWFDGPRDGNHELTASYYDALEQLRVTDSRYVNLGATGPDNTFVGYSREEYRYDALGRRILMRTRKYGNDQVDGIGPTCWCMFGWISRFVWDGSQRLYETRGRGDDSASAGNLEDDTVTTGGAGRVAYTNSTEVDRPFGFIRIGYTQYENSTLMYFQPFAITPVWDWRGYAESGIYSNGAMRNCKTIGDSGSCVAHIWVEGLTAFQQPFASSLSWFGGLVDNKTDGSGLQYQRNRYYDPESGRFTQEDPIGIAGGLNVYGFAGGDPVTFSDPFGLCPVPANTRNSICMSLYIQAASILGGLFAGDDRGPSHTSPDSRANLTIDLSSNSADLDVAPTYVAGEAGEGLAEVGPSSASSVTVTFVPDEHQVQVDFHLENGADVGPATDGHIVFMPDGNGGYTSHGHRDQFPSLEAYYWHNGNVQTIVQQDESFSVFAFPFFPQAIW